MKNEKYEFLEKEGLLNQKPERISPSLFAENDFFDPLDLTQVRYEMLRSARIGKTSVAKACKLFGFSREFLPIRTKFYGPWIGLTFRIA